MPTRTMPLCESLAKEFYRYGHLAPSKPWPRGWRRNRELANPQSNTLEVAHIFHSALAGWCLVEGRIQAFSPNEGNAVVYYVVAFFMGGHAQW